MPNFKLFSIVCERVSQLWYNFLQCACSASMLTLEFFLFLRNVVTSYADIHVSILCCYWRSKENYTHLSCIKGWFCIIFLIYYNPLLQILYLFNLSLLGVARTREQTKGHSSHRHEWKEFQVSFCLHTCHDPN